MRFRLPAARGEASASDEAGDRPGVLSHISYLLAKLGPAGLMRTLHRPERIGPRPRTERIRIGGPMAYPLCSSSS